jgi:hypothetical protein
VRRKPSAPDGNVVQSSRSVTWAPMPSSLVARSLSLTGRATQLLARARRFCSFFLRAARLRAVFRRLGRFSTGIVASYPSFG